ncbi:MAG: DUF4474 domain-containing protein [Clostridia bacterium]|nr:DUF4474 domain-containing protein [Clostridia bacterium]
MKYIKKPISLLLALVIAFSAIVVSVSAETVDSEIVDSEIIEIEPPVENVPEQEVPSDDGTPVNAMPTINGVLDSFTRILRVITGTWMFPRQSMNIEVDEFLTSVSEYITLNSGLDFAAILGNIPKTNQIVDLVTDTFQIDTAELRSRMYEQSNKYFAEDNAAMGFVYGFIGIYFSVIQKCEIYSQPREGSPEIYEVYIRLTFKDGGQEVFFPGLLINTITGECSNVGNDGIVGIGFNFNLSEMLVYATINCWMRDFGFCYLYDLLATSMPVFFKYDTRRFKFEYNDMEYMIQIWKGNYTISNGGEVGVYCRDKSKSGTYYDCANDEQMLPMSMQILHGDKVLVNKPLQLHWWVNGFNLGKTLYSPQSLTMKFSIAMTDEEMLKAFCEAIDNSKEHDVIYTVDGLTVNAIW